MIIKVKTLVFCEKNYEYGDVHVMSTIREGSGELHSKLPSPFVG